MNNKMNLDQVSAIGDMWRQINNKGGLNKISIRYFRSNLDYISSNHEMKIMFKKNINYYSHGIGIRLKRLFKTHSNCHSIEECNTSRFFRRK